MQPLDGSPHTAPTPCNPPQALWQAWQAAHEGRRGSNGGGRRPVAAAALRQLEARGLEPESGLTFAAAVEAELRLYGME